MAAVYPWLDHVASALHGEDWLFVGGAMTQLHCALSEIGYGRSTNDVDAGQRGGEVGRKRVCADHTYALTITKSLQSELCFAPPIPGRTFK